MRPPEVTLPPTLIGASHGERLIARTGDDGRTEIVTAIERQNQKRSPTFEPRPLVKARLRPPYLRVGRVIVYWATYPTKWRTRCRGVLATYASFYRIVLGWEHR